MNPIDKVKAQSKTLALVDEVMTAYSDCNGHKGPRNLGYIASKSVTAQEICNLMRAAVPEGYNGFEADKSIPVLVEFFGDAEYFVAREGSVCIYIKPKQNVWFTRRTVDCLNADEVLFDSEKQMFRVWWD